MAKDRTMKKYIIILLSMLLFSGNSFNAQINPIKRPQKNKTEKAQKQDKANSKANKQNTQSKKQKQNSGTRTTKEKRGENSNLSISISSNASDGTVYIDGIFYGRIP